MTRMKHALSIRTLLLAALLLCVARCVAEEPGAHRVVPKADATPVAVGGTEDPVAHGRGLFAGKGICHACHGPAGEGSQIAPDLTDDAWLHFDAPVTPEKLVAIIDSGVRNPIKHPGAMPPKGGASLTDEEVAAVAAYVFSLSN